MDALNNLHSQVGRSASDRETVLDAARTAGLDVAAAEEFLGSADMEAAVWESYGNTIRRYGIHAIPYFVFSVPELGVQVLHCGARHAQNTVCVCVCRCVGV